MKRYEAKDHVRTNLLNAANEGALYLTRLFRGEITPDKEALTLGSLAKGATGAFTRYEATLSARDQTSVVVSKLLAGENSEALQQYIAASLPDHPAVRIIELPKLVSDGA